MRDIQAPQSRPVRGQLPKTPLLAGLSRPRTTGSGVLQVGFEEAEKRLGRSLGITRKVTLMRHQLVECERREQSLNQSPYARVNVDPEPVLEQVVPVNGEDDERFADALPERCRVVAHLAVDACGPAVILRQFQGRVRL